MYAIPGIFLTWLTDPNHSISTILLLSLCFLNFPSIKYSFYFYIILSFLIIFPSLIIFNPIFLTQWTYFLSTSWFSSEWYFHYLFHSLVDDCIEHIHLSNWFTFTMNKLKFKLQVDLTLATWKHENGQTAILQHHLLFTCGGRLGNNRCVD